MSVPPPPRYPVLGVGIHALGLAEAQTRLVASVLRGERGYVCCCDAHSLSQACRNARHREILNRALLATPDGMPVVWMGRLAGHRGVQRVYGPDLMLAVCEATAGTDLTHFFYGAGPGTAEQLAAALAARFPGLRVAGTQTPPFAPLSAGEARQLADRMRALRPHFFWVGLSTPKQEAFMAEFLPQLEVNLMLGVGAAFDLLSGRVRQAPRWIRHSGGEWLWRICQEPRRLGPRYLKNQPLFLLRILGQLTGLKTYPPLPADARSPDAERP